MFLSLFMYIRLLICSQSSTTNYRKRYVGFERFRSTITSSLRFLNDLTFEKCKNTFIHITSYSFYHFWSFSWSSSILPELGLSSLNINEGISVLRYILFILFFKTGLVVLFHVVLQLSFYLDLDYVFSWIKKN